MRDFVVTVEEGFCRLRLPLQPGGLDRSARVRAFGNELEQRGMHRIVERAQHARHVLERRVLLRPLLHGARRLALEVDDDKIVMHQKYLPKMVVAVQAGLDAIAAVLGMGRDSRQQIVAQRNQPIDVVANGLRKRIAPPPQAIEHCHGLRAHALGPCAHVGRAERYRIECRIAGVSCERRVQLAGTHAERARKRGVAVVHIRRGRSPRPS